MFLYFHYSHVKTQGEGRHGAIERHQMHMIRLILRFLEGIPMIIEKSSSKGSRHFVDVHLPSKEGVDIVEATLLVNMIIKSINLILLYMHLYVLLIYRI